MSGRQVNTIVQQSVEQHPPLNRAVGSLCGMALADALGAPLEFLPAVDHPSTLHFLDSKTWSYTGEKNAFQLKRGQWTDDASMGLCVADSLLFCRELQGSDLRSRFHSWWFHGYNNAFRNDPDRGASVGLGGNIGESLYSIRPGEVPTPIYGSNRLDSGNGSLMRLAAIPIFADTKENAIEMARYQSLTTHPGPMAAETCAFLSYFIFRAIHRPSDIQITSQDFLVEIVSEYLLRLEKEDQTPDLGTENLVRLLKSQEKHDSLERNWNWKDDSLDIQATLNRRGRNYNGYPVSAGYFGSYSMDALALAMHSFYHSNDFDQAVIGCINHLGDADSTGSITGQMAGAFYGYNSFLSNPNMQSLNKWDDGHIALRAIILSLLKNKKTGQV
eukprot:Lithocolla_globosa_v1_NODE_1643_length_2424_cov_8.280287.p1 type:complete len:387 gc:universal NODE_1643_length_2424_cov_8.280287:1164-2324(+)